MLAQYITLELKCVINIFCLCHNNKFNYQYGHLSLYMNHENHNNGLETGEIGGKTVRKRMSHVVSEYDDNVMTAGLKTVISVVSD